MRYIVKKGDTLWAIAKRQLANPLLWPEIARLNRLKAPYLIVIGQGLALPDRYTRASTGDGLRPGGSARSITGISQPPMEEGAGTIPGRAFLFVLADEILPSGKVVRKVLQVPGDMGEYVAANPELFGIKPVNPHSPVSLGEHALGNTNSRFTSASTKAGGAPNMSGRPVYIDIAKAKAAGVTIHSTEEIIADLDELAKADPSLKPRVDKLKGVIKAVEGEVLLEGNVPAKGIKSSGAMATTRALRGVQAVGILLTVYDLGQATVKSVDQGSVKPIAAEGVRQVGGWGMGLVGMKLGCLAGAAVGIETGPGAVLTCGIGGLVFGTAGYFGFDWVADFIDEN
jgi:LysM repeat protein